jgi:hypothetical protein
MNLDRFKEAYRLGGAGRPAYDPALMASASDDRTVRLLDAATGQTTATPAA